MAGYFFISDVDSFNWVLKNPVIDARYNNLPLRYQTKSYNPSGNYYAPWQLNDQPPIQVISDFVPTLKFYKCEGKIFYRNVDLPEVATSLIGVTYKCYQGVVDFSTFAEGNYYAEITYTDDDENTVTWMTSLLNVKANQPDTILCQYKSTFNTQGVIFKETSLELNFRFPGWIVYDTPGSDSQLFTDQIHNVTQESSISYDVCTMYVGRAKGVPYWVIQKMNDIFSLNQKRFDGTYFEKAEDGAKFTATRPESTKNRDAFWSLEVIENQDFFIDAFTVGDNPNENDIQVITRSKQYLLNGGNITVSNTFKKFSTLVGIQIDNRGLEVFNILVGITPGGMELGKYKTSGRICDFMSINKGFDSPTSVYLTGLSGFDTDVTVVYYQLDDRTTVPTTGGGGFVKGTMYIYREQSDGDFESDWVLATGLGVVGSKYEGCAMSDGRNGTEDMQGMTVTGWNRLNSADRDTTIGDIANLLTITVDQMPAHTHGTDMYPNKSRSGGAIGGQGSDKNGSVTSSTGGGQPIDIQNYTRRMMFFEKIVD